jgi:L-seryl-tRNA(Ser) seleniumtransferase
MHTTYLRQLPAVDEILRTPQVQTWMAQFSRRLVTAAVRQALQHHRQRILQASDPAALEAIPVTLPTILAQISAYLTESQMYRLQRLINATGVIVMNRHCKACFPQCSPCSPGTNPQPLCLI